jgi:acyl-CoA synthetase (AMP-forming)/AMP-acid ligase II
MSSDTGGVDESAGRRGDLEWGTTPRLVVAAAARWGDHPAIVDGDTTISYAALADRVDAAARAFLAAGIEPGDRAAIWSPNIWEWIVAALGLHAAGGVLVPLNTRFKGNEAAYVLGKSRARMLFTVTDFLDVDYVDMLRSSGAETPDLERIVVLRGAVPEGATSFADFLEGGSSVAAERSYEAMMAVEAGDLSDIIFTSGTTGKPKGVMTAHGQNLRAFRDWCDVVGLRHGDRYLIVNPFFHAFGYKAGILASLMMGVTIHPHAVFDVPQVMQRVAAEQITMLPGPPTLYQSILNHPDLAKFDMSSLRLSVTGAAAIPVELILRMRAELSFETIITGYGLTESCGIATMCRHDDDPETIATRSGRAIPGIEVLCVDEHGAEVPRGEPGEVVVRGYNVMQGYFDDEDETAATIDADGWLHTGDIGEMDDRGYIWITDRMKDMFITGGFNAYPAEIENLLLAHEGIAQVAVVGIPDERMGEVGMAFVVPRPDVTLDPAEVVAWSREHMANFKVPRRVAIVDSLPLNASGKVLKFELRDRAAASS